jgi:hypothetical protein
MPNQEIRGFKQQFFMHELPWMRFSSNPSTRSTNAANPSGPLTSIALVVLTVSSRQ